MKYLGMFAAVALAVLVTVYAMSDYKFRIYNSASNKGSVSQPAPQASAEASATDVAKEDHADADAPVPQILFVDKSGKRYIGEEAKGCAECTAVGVSYSVPKGRVGDINLYNLNWNQNSNHQHLVTAQPAAATRTVFQTEDPPQVRRTVRKQRVVEPEEMLEPEMVERRTASLPPPPEFPQELVVYSTQKQEQKSKGFYCFRDPLKFLGCAIAVRGIHEATNGNGRRSGGPVVPNPNFGGPIVPPPGGPVVPGT